VTGSSATDSATVTGTSGIPTGSVTFTLYSGSPGSGTLVAGYAADTVSLDASGKAGSVSTGTLAAGSYYFMASYGGNSTYGSTASSPEPFSIAVQTPTLSTTPNVTGLSSTDTATVSGTSGTPTGSVTFTLYSGSFGSGTATGFSDTETLSGGSATSASTGTLAGGSYYFMITYSGDGNFSAVTPGSPESFLITPTSAPKSPKKKAPPYKIPTSAPQAGAGGAAGVTFNGGLLSIGSLMLLAGLAAMALKRRRRNA
jgi:hypothetical protein